MALYLINGDNKLVSFQNVPTSVLSYPALPGARLRSFQTENIKLFVKDFISDLFSISYKLFQFSNTQKIKSVSDAFGIHSRVMLQNDLTVSVNTIGEMQYKAGTVSLLAGRIDGCTATLEAGVEYRALDLYAGEHLARQLTHFFSEMEVDTGAIKNLFPYPCFVSPGLQKVIDDILDCPYDEATSAFYYDVKIREYFYLLIKDCIHSREIKYHFTPYEIDQIHLARELLLSDLTTPPFTVRQLARKVSLNELKLKVGFTHFFRTSVFDCFQRARLYNARQQVLQTNKPLKEIGSLAGYSRTPNFITAFRKFYGYTPGSLRR